MQLILVLVIFLLLGGGKSPYSELLNSDMLDVLKYISGDNGELDKLVKEAEQVTQIINLITPGSTANRTAPPTEQGEPSDESVSGSGIFLKPIANIADSSIYNALSNAIS